MFFFVIFRVFLPVNLCFLFESSTLPNFTLLLPPIQLAGLLPLSFISFLSCIPSISPCHLFIFNLPLFNSRLFSLPLSFTLFLYSSLGLSLSLSLFFLPKNICNAYKKNKYIFLQISIFFRAIVLLFF